MDPSLQFFPGLYMSWGNPGPRPPKEINSYRAELQGMLTLLLAITHLCSNRNLTAGQITIGCDNKGVIQLVQCSWSYIPCSQNHADLLWAIHLACKWCSVSLRFQYVAGHQDNLMRFDDLPLLAQLNIQADSMAKQALHVLVAQGAPLSSILSLIPLGPSQSKTFQSHLIHIRRYYIIWAPTQHYPTGSIKLALPTPQHF